MSEPNLLSPLVDATWDVITTLYKFILSKSGKKHYDFNALFRNIDLKIKTVNM